MSLAASKARLAEMTKDLLARWGEVRETWLDARATDFELTYMRDLKAHVDEAVTAMDEIDTILLRMRRDCE